MLEAERSLRRVRGYKGMDKLVDALRREMTPGCCHTRRVRSGSSLNELWPPLNFNNKRGSLRGTKGSSLEAPDTRGLTTAVLTTAKPTMSSSPSGRGIVLVPGSLVRKAGSSPWRGDGFCLGGRVQSSDVLFCPPSFGPAHGVRLCRRALDYRLGSPGLKRLGSAALRQRGWCSGIGGAVVRAAQSEQVIGHGLHPVEIVDVAVGDRNFA